MTPPMAPAGAHAAPPARRWMKTALIISLGLNIGLATPPVLFGLGIIKGPFDKPGAAGHPPPEPALPRPGDVVVFDLRTEFNRMIEDLDLSAGQRAKIEELIPSFTGPAPEMITDVENFHERLSRELLLGPDDPASFEALKKDAIETHTRVFEFMVGRVRAIAAELTPEQRRKLYTMLQERRGQLMGFPNRPPAMGDRPFVFPIPAPGFTRSPTSS